MFVFDENMPPAIAVALRDLGEPVSSVHLLGLNGLKDDKLIPTLAEHGAHLIGRDRKMLRNTSYVAALRTLHVSAYFLHEGNSSALEIARTVFRCWPAVRQWERAHDAQTFAALYAANTPVRQLTAG